VIHVLPHLVLASALDFIAFWLARCKQAITLVESVSVADYSEKSSVFLAPPGKMSNTNNQRFFLG